MSSYISPDHRPVALQMNPLFNPAANPPATQPLENRKRKAETPTEQLAQTHFQGPLNSALKLPNTPS